MAYVPEDVRLQASFLVSDTTTRAYAFAFPVERADDVAVDLDGAPLDRSRFAVELTPGAPGGRVRLLDGTETPLPAALALGQRIRIYRDTEVLRRTQFGRGGYALGDTAETEARQVHAVLEELTDRLETHRTILTDDAAGFERVLLGHVEQQTKPYARSGGPPIALGDTDFADHVENAVDGDRVSLTDRTLDLQSTDGTPHAIPLPGIDVLLNGRTLHEASSIDFHGTGLTGSVTPDGVIINIPQGGGSGDDTTSGGGGGTPGVPGSAGTTTTHTVLSSVSLALSEAAPDAAVAITTTDFGTWTTWTDLAELPALTAAGLVLLSSTVKGRVTTPPDQGGDRVYGEIGIFHKRGAVETLILETFTYIRNTGNARDSSPPKDPGTNTASQRLAGGAGCWHEGQAGDSYVLKYRLLSQIAARRLEIGTSGTKIQGAYLATTTTDVETQTGVVPTTPSVPGSGGGMGGSGITPEQAQHIITNTAYRLRHRHRADVLRNHALPMEQIPYAQVATGTAWPAAEAGRQMVATLTASDGTVTPAYTFDLSDVYALPDVGQGLLTDANSIEWDLAGGGNDKARLGRRAGNVVFGASQTDDYTLTLVVVEDDAEPWTRRSSSATIPLARQQKADTTRGGYIDAGDYDRIQDAVQETALTAADTLAGTDLEAADAFVLDDDSVASGSPLRRLPLSELDARYARAGTGEAAFVWDRSGYTDGDNGRFPAYKHGTAITGGTIDSTPDVAARWDDGTDSYKLTPAGKLAEVEAAFSGGTWAVAQGTAATTPWVSTTVSATRPTAGAGPGATYTIHQSTPTGPATGDGWVLVRVPLTILYHADRVRLAEGADLAEAVRVALDPARSDVIRLDDDTTYAYYAIRFMPFPADATWRAEVFTPFHLRPGKVEGLTRQGEGQTVFATQYPGVSPARTDTDQLVASATALSPTFDLDTAGNGSGEFHVSLELAMTAQAPGVSFTRGLTASQIRAEDRSRTLSTIVFASDLAEEPDFTTSNLEGLTLFEVPVWAANTRQGRYYLLLVHDGSNEVALYRHWVGEAGSPGLTLSAECRVSFTPAGAAAAAPAPAPTFTTVGPTWFTSSALILTGTAGAIVTTGAWTVSDDAPSGSQALANSTVSYPARPPSDAINGLWFISERAADQAAFDAGTFTEEGRVFRGWGVGVTTSNAPPGVNTYADGYLLSQDGAGGGGIVVRGEVNEQSGRLGFFLLRDTSQIPPAQSATPVSYNAFTRVRVCPAGVFAA